MTDCAIADSPKLSVRALARQGIRVRLRHVGRLADGVKRLPTWVSRSASSSAAATSSEARSSRPWEGSRRLDYMGMLGTIINALALQDGSSAKVSSRA